MMVEKVPDCNLSDRLRKKVKEAQESQNEDYLSLLPAVDIQPPDPDTDKDCFSKERQNYEHHLDSLNSSTLTGNEFDELDDLKEALNILNQTVEKLADPSDEMGKLGFLRRFIRKLIAFGLGSEMVKIRTSLSAMTRSVNIITHKTRIFVGKQQGYNTETAEFGQSIVPVIDEKIRYQLEKTATYLKDRMDVFHEQTDRRQNEISDWLQNTNLTLQGFIRQLNSFESELRRGLALQHRKIEESLASVPKPIETDRVSDPVAKTTFGSAGGDYAYYLFETQGRGSEESICEIQSDFVSMFKNVKGIVLDIGCGRGEFLTLLKNEKIEARGIDANTDMVAICKEKGLSVVCGDAIDEMVKIENDSIGGIFAGQVVEHLKSEELIRWLNLAYRILKPGGVLVFDTINTSSPFALTSHFFKDPTHQQPRHPDTYRFLTEITGFEEITVTYRSPIKPDEKPKIPEISDDQGSTQYPNTLRDISAALEKITDYVFAPCDILVSAKKTGRSCE